MAISSQNPASPHQSGKRKKIVLVEYQNEEDLEELLIKLCGSEIVEG